LSDCDGCSEDCAHCAADATCAAERHATSDQRAAIERFVEAKAAFEPHRALYKHQDEQYRAMKDNLGHEKAMVVFDFSPYNATALRLTQEESRRSGMQVLHIVVIRRAGHVSTTTTCTSNVIFWCDFSHFVSAQPVATN
jgi:hypothetical protein